jgi:chemotaxis signal transduction protein
MNESRDDLEKQQRFNWEVTKRRLTDTVDDLRIPDEVQELLQKHARAIGLTLPPVNESIQQTHLAFLAGRLPMAVALEGVRAVFVPWKTTVVEGGPDHLAEVVYFQGRPVPLLSFDGTLRLRSQAHEAPRGQVVLLESEGRLLGLRSEEVLGPLFVDERRLRQNVSEQTGPFVKGITQEQVLVLNVSALIGAVMALKLSF